MKLKRLDWGHSLLVMFVMNETTNMVRRRSESEWVINGDACSSITPHIHNIFKEYEEEEKICKKSLRNNVEFNQYPSNCNHKVSCRDQICFSEMENNGKVNAWYIRRKNYLTSLSTVLAWSILKIVPFWGRYWWKVPPNNFSGS